MKAVLVVLASLFVLVSCTKKDAGKEEYGLEVKNTLRVNITTEPPSLDWQKATDTTSSDIINNMMAGLTDYDFSQPEIGIVPGLATEWTPNKTATVFTFKLRPGVKWTNGVEFTGQQVVDGWERLLNPATASEYAYFLFSIKNAQEYNQGKIKDFNQVGVKLLDPMTLEVTLNRPKSYFPMLLTHQSTYPILKDLPAKHGDRWTSPENIATLGQYRLKVWEHDKAIVLEKNDQFFGAPGKIPFILCRMIADQSTAINLFDAGKLDILKTLPSIEIKKLRARPEYRKVDMLYTYFYGFNVRKPPFNNLKVRKAFALAVDRDEIVNLVGGDRLPMSSWIPRGMFGHDPAIGIKFDPAKAKELFKEAGFADPKKFPKVTIGFNTNEDHKRIAENVQAQLKRNLGVEVELKNEEWKVYINSLKVDPPNMYRMGWVADYPDPDNYMALMTSYSENNRTGWKNKAYDELVEMGAAELDKGKRKEIYTKAHKLMMEDEMPAIPFYSAIAQYLISSRVKNFPLNAMDDTNYGIAEIGE